MPADIANCYFWLKIMKELKLSKKYDVIIIGAGHAGCEAALAASRMGCSTLLLTINLSTVAQMSCNPAIGGPGKGQIAREIDALGGQMARVIDQAGIQFRMLNTKKGPAVWAPRAQADKLQYQVIMKQVLEQQEKLELQQLLVTDLIIDKDRAVGVITNTKLKIYGRTVIIATGTFLNGLIHIGQVSMAGGRLGEFAALELAKALKRLGFAMGRLKTGTPARVNARTVDFSCFNAQKGDLNPQPFSYDNKSLEVEQICCYLGYTNKNTHKIVRDNLHRSPLYNGKITGTGVRYCPSIEDKVVKFPQKDRHQIFLEPEGRNTCEIYLNGLSTSLSQDVQIKILKSIDGLKNAQIMRFGYGIEYDFADPTQVLATLETKNIKNLYFAGQINGTTGYEEAAGQGLIAGINAALKIKRKPALIVDRTQGYIGVLIDDLVTKGTKEPYRLFPSRVEHRLVLRQDNADLRFGECAYKLGLLSREKIDKIRKKQQQIALEIEKLRKLKQGNVSLEKILKRPDTNYDKIAKLDPRLKQIDADVKNQVEIEVKYAGYIQREKALIHRLKKLEQKSIPDNFPFQQIGGLKKEAQEKLTLIRPRSLGQAMRISGVTSSDISLVLLHLEKRLQREAAEKKR